MTRLELIRDCLVFISDNFAFGKLDNLALNHHEAVGGFFDASQERAGDTSFEGYEMNYHVLEHWLTAEAFRAGGRLWDIHVERCPQRAWR
jgi:hypothetical protein